MEENRDLPVSAGKLKDILAGFKAQMDTLKDEIRTIRSQSHGTGIPFFNGATRSNVWRQDQPRNDERDRRFEWTRTSHPPMAPRRILVPARPDPRPFRRAPTTQPDCPHETELSDT
ncbi:hypothetical protein SOVF_145990, partial [Spinacia oleracea]